MAANKFYRLILDTLQGRTEQLETVSPERRDWAGPGALLDLFRKTSGKDRSALIQAFGQVIQDHSAPVPVLAQVVQMASSLDLAEVEPQVRNLQAELVAAQEPLRGAVINYLAFRRLNAPPQPTTPSEIANGKPKARKAR